MLAKLRKVMGYWRGGSYVLLWYSSILLGFYYLYAPLLPLVFLSRPAYRRITDSLFQTWEAFNTTVLELVYGMELVLTGDQIQEQDNALIILNHPTRTDWNFLWPVLFHASPSHNTKIVLKESVRRVPGAGWIMAMSRFIYLKRKWAEDSLTLDTAMDYFSQTRSEGARQLVLFPEGTNLSAGAREKSRLYAERNNLPTYSHLLHPRTAGFVHLAHGMQERGLLTAVYDLTIAYPDRKPDTEMDLLRGELPRRVHVHLTRYAAGHVPTTFVGLERWIQELWRDKEARLQKFYQQDTPHFPHHLTQQALPCPTKTLQPLCLVAWLYFLYCCLYSTLFHTLPKLWVLAVTLIIYIIEYRGCGLQELELQLHAHGLLGLLFPWARVKQPPARPIDEDMQDDFEHLKGD